MCGFVGWINFSEPIANETDIIGKMAEKLAHRGPDAEGFWFSEHVALGHRRLVVVDPLASNYLENMYQVAEAFSSN